MPEYRKKLIEVAGSVEAINRESAREKSMRHGHPSTLHRTFAQAPTEAAKGEESERPEPLPGTAAPVAGAPAASGGERPAAGMPEVPSAPHRFQGTVNVSLTQPGGAAGKIGEEVLQHLTALMGAKVEATLEIQAQIPDNAPENVVRTVTENCPTLKFKSFGFEET